MAGGSSFGKRSNKHVPNAGLRDIAPTHARPLHTSPARKFGDGEGARVEVRAEQLMARMLDIHPDVQSYEPQGIGADLVQQTLLYTKEQREQAKRRYADAPGTSYYTADFHARLTSAARRVYEVKDARYPSDRASEERFRRASPIFRRHGFDVCKIVVPAEMDPIWNNVNLVHKAAYQVDLRARLPSSVEALEGLEVTVARDALKAIGASANELPVLIAMGVIAVDLFDGRIRAGMRAVLAHGTLDHLRVIERLTT
jgi:hypothetical protein